MKFKLMRLVLILYDVMMMMKSLYLIIYNLKLCS